MGSDHAVRDGASGGSGDISIHAPAWGATDLAASEGIDVSISIHAPAWGATSARTGPRSWSSNFNPRSRMGSDPGEDCRSGFTDTDFNPRSRMGSDRPDGRVLADERISIHAPAWGATGHRRHRRPKLHDFNPRSRMGSDGGHAVHRRPRARFQSTLPHGERLKPMVDQITSMYEFQSTLPHGERPGSAWTPRSCSPFQSTLPHGERPSAM